MRSPQKLVWSEGTLLSPQHLQSLDAACEALAGQQLVEKAVLSDLLELAATLERFA